MAAKEVAIKKYVVRLRADERAQTGQSRTPAFPASARAARISNGLPFPSSQRAPFQPARHEPSIRDEDIPFGDRRAIEPLAAFLIGQLDEAKAFLWKVEMKPP